MVILIRKKGERFFINKQEIKVLALDGKRVCLSIEVPLCLYKPNDYNHLKKFRNLLKN